MQARRAKDGVDQAQIDALLTQAREELIKGLRPFDPAAAPTDVAPI